ncbi:hypothetical protein SAMN05428988_4957 [Chitinophaga sp. YR573]|uniref:hypothetical protein n=1 Tax=Chitinophaga sp. YR573 TaxID=1881040 RepID=UPI0008C07314|nr:hypothetical protein [Chitinophaga sp. YR573]SEW38956.1 hypothetical protein SAMN05428988_4957 [Chitinophaga sp. YR573]
MAFKGVRIEPLSSVTKDFRTVKTFTVTARNSTKKTYYVSVHYRDAIFIGGLVQLLALDSKDGSLLWKDNLNQNFVYSNVVHTNQQTTLHVAKKNPTT